MRLLVKLALLVAAAAREEEFFDVFLAGGVDCDDCVSTNALAAAQIEEMRLEVFALVNGERRKQNIGPLCLNNELGEAAQLHSEDQQSCSEMSHTGCDGSSMVDRIKRAGYSYSAAGENVAWNQKSAEQVMRAWMNSSGHRANILNSRFKNIGIGLSNNFYWTQVFGSPSSSGDGCNDETAAPTPPTPSPPSPQPEPNCVTVSGPDQKGKVGEACLFPFTHRGKTYSSCTRDLDPNNELWCSVKTDSKGNHAIGNWGYCGTLCPGVMPSTPVPSTQPRPTSSPTTLPTPLPPTTKFPSMLPTPSLPTKFPSMLPTPPLSSPSKLPTKLPPTAPTNPTSPAPGNNECTWLLKQNDTFCYGNWGVERKVLLNAGGSQSMTWPECRALVQQDPQCSDIAYGAGAIVATSGCRCVIKGYECLAAPSNSGNSVYKKECPEPTTPCSEVESTNRQMQEAQAELSALKAEVQRLQAQLAAARRRHHRS